ncbi:cullin [Anaeramoeba flamelloides]|uniref:Cullin n=1 Tax=Anaeramoeba flamelloides TaxID=1746091 RepID=A0AAV7ZQC7_9EUKA|nr:cullin [Anaeramoeba flamelloides]
MEIFKKETKRVVNYLDRTTLAKMIQSLEKNFLIKHMKTLKQMETGLVYMLNNKKVEDLKNVYTLFLRVNEKKWLKENFQKMILIEGKQIMSKFKETKNESQNYHTIQELIDVKKKYDGFLQNSFNKDKEFEDTLNRNFYLIINLNRSIAKNLPKFIDNRIRKLKNESSEQIKELIDSFIDIFKFIAEKDLFKKFYEFYLSRRLLSSQNVFEEQEKLIVHKFKINSWANFTQKMEDMFKDINVSRDWYQSFQIFQKEKMNSHEIIPMAVKILKESVWPIKTIPNCIPPPLMKRNLENFELFYQSIHADQILNWRINVGTVELFFHLENRKSYLLIVSTFQTLILLNFNHIESNSDSNPNSNSMELINGNENENENENEKEKEMVQEMVKEKETEKENENNDNNINENENNSNNKERKSKRNNKSKQYSCNEIAQLTKIPMQYLKSSLASLISSKSKILRRIKFKNKKVISEDDVFQVNTRFKSTQRKIKVVRISQNYTEKEKEKNMVWVNQERKNLIESMVIKVMKSRRVLKHEKLIAQVTKLVLSKFKPNITMIDQRIRSLIDREYLSKQDNQYTYLP